MTCTHSHLARACAELVPLADDQAQDYCGHAMTLRVLDHEEPEGRRPGPGQSPDRGVGPLTAPNDGRQRLAGAAARADVGASSRLAPRSRMAQASHRATRDGRMTATRDLPFDTLQL